MKLDNFNKWLDRHYPVGATVEALVGQAPEAQDHLINTWQTGEILSHELIRDMSGFSVSAVILHMYHPDGWHFTSEIEHAVPHGGARPGAGRPAGPPQLNIRIAATPEEKEAILAGTTPRERTEALLQAAKKTKG